MDESQLMMELARLRTEVEALRLANASLERQMLDDAEQTDAMLRALESQGDALRKANLRQAKQNNFVQRVMDTTGALMVVLGLDGRITQANRRYALEFDEAGGPAGAWVLDDRLHPDERQKLADELGQLPWPVHSPLYETVRRAGGNYAGEHRLAGRDGRYRHYWLEASLLHTPQGKEEGAVLCATDITPLKEQQERLRHSERLLKEAQQIAQLGHWELDLSQDELVWSEEVFRIFERVPGAFSPSHAGFLECVHPDDRAAVEAAYAASLGSRRPYAIEYRLLFPDGRTKWVHERGIPHYDADGNPVRSMGTVQDISAQRLAEEQLHLAASVFDSSLNGIIVTDAKARILKVNHAFSEILGYSSGEVVGRRVSLLKSGHHDLLFYQALWKSLEQHGKWQGEIWDRRKDGQLIPLWQSISSVRGHDGRVVRYIGVFYDLSEQKQSAEHIHRLAYYDALTDLPNRRLFNERCEHALERAQRESWLFALLFLDLDRFKRVNDSLGHPVGDDLLRLVSQRLKGCLRHGDTVSRLGGDEFIILLEGIAGHADAEWVARKILAALRQPLMVQGHKLEVGTSIGISCYPSHGEDATTLIKNADLALYQAKEEGRGNFRFYEARLTERARERHFLEGELREALKRDELLLHYQPQITLADGGLVGAEALLRWRHAQQGLIPPDKFIPIAEDSGLIIPIGEWVLRTACLQAKAWMDEGKGLRRIAVNLSGVQIEHSDILDTVQRVLAETGLPPECLELEITETYIMRQAQRSIQVMEDLRALGISLAIDDFGTGQSSLGYLKRLPVDKLKIDRSFVMDIPQDANDMAITRAIIALGHSLRLTVVAEGVENMEQVDFLTELECDEGQGYHYSRPMDARSFEALLNSKAGFALGSRCRPE